MISPFSIASRKGSSPLARGLHGHPGDGDGGARIIPARAGFTSGTSPRRPHGRDHPRSRGVYMRWPAHDRSSMGSSPLARGLPRTSWPTSETTRIIPARAGFTHRGVPALPEHGDHPRSRGVYHDDHGLAARRRRIIPARAGFTAHPYWGSRRDQDHPRSRGVYPLSRWPWRGHLGSSPLARGLRAGRVR